MAAANWEHWSEDGTIHIAALGSSFAAGPGIQPQVNVAAGRSEHNYAHILAKRLGAQLTDLSVSGATLKNVLAEPQDRLGTHFEPQLDSLPSDVSIVTITCGGNDLNYIGSIYQLELNASFLGRLISHFRPVPDHDESLTAEDVAERFITVIDKIREISPRSRIFLVEYLTLLGPHTRPGVDVSLDAAQIQHCQDIGGTLQVAYRMAARARARCKVIPVGKLSQEHELGSREPWVEGFSVGMLFWGKAPFHPNARGMEAVADMIYDEIKDGESALRDDETDDEYEI